MVPWGTDYELFKINSSEGFDIIFSGRNGTSYRITLLKTKPDGTVEKEFHEVNGSTIIRVDANYSNVTMIKTQVNDETSGTSPYDVTLRPPEPTEPKSILDGVSSTFKVNGSTANISVHVVSKPLNNTIHDLEIFFDQQQPPWTGAEIKGLPEGWQGQVFEGGLRVFTNNKPLQTSIPKNFVIEFDSDGIPQFLTIHVTNETHNNIGNIGSQRIGTPLGTTVDRCPDSNCSGNGTTMHIQTEIVCMDLRSVQPIGPIYLRPTVNGSSENASHNAGDVFFDIFNLLNPDPEKDFAFPLNGSLGCLATHPFDPWRILAVEPGPNSSHSYPADSFFDIFVEISVPCVSDESICVQPGEPPSTAVCGNNVIEEGEQCDPPDLFHEFPTLELEPLAVIDEINTTPCLGEIFTICNQECQYEDICIEDVVFLNDTVS